MSEAEILTQPKITTRTYNLGAFGRCNYESSSCGATAQIALQTGTSMTLLNGGGLKSAMIQLDGDTPAAGTNVRVALLRECSSGLWLTCSHVSSYLATYMARTKVIAVRG